jgi:hypothetical protein
MTASQMVIDGGKNSARGVTLVPARSTNRPMQSQTLIARMPSRLGRSRRSQCGRRNGIARFLVRNVD